MSFDSISVVRTYGEALVHLRRVLCFASAVLLSFPIASAQANPKPPTPEPSALIDIAGIGYPQLSRTERLLDDANVTLDFVDEDHVLLTFNPKKLFPRLPSCPPEHDDRLIRAVILEIPTGKVVRAEDWYLHDHRRYLWSLGSGKFLLRRLNNLYLVDATLHEKLLLQSPKDLLWVSVTPDHSQILVETAEDPPKPSAADSSNQESKSKPGFVLQFLDSESMTPQRTLRLSAVVNLDGTSTGYADTVHRGDLWLIRYGPSPEDRRNIARVRSRGVPRIFYSGNNSLLIGRCCSSDGNYSVSAFTVTGHRLWRQRWNLNRYFPAAAGNADYSRIAVSTVSHRPYAEVTVSSAAEQDTNFSLEQNVQVLEAASGAIVQSIEVSPVIMSEQNVSLSPDGRRLATLTDTGIEIYELPPISVEERAKFAALKADVPGLYTLPVDSGVSADEGTNASKQIPQPVSNSSVAPPSSPAAAASAENQDAALATFKASAQAVVVDVVVTDGQGHPVKGLIQRDFQLSEDGERQELRYFREVITDANKHSPPPAPPKAPNIFSNTSQAQEPGSLVVVLLDLLNTPSQDQLYAREQLLKFLQSQSVEGKKSQFALCTLTGDPSSHLRLIQGFTSDNAQLLGAASSKKGAPKTVGWQMAQEGTRRAINSITELSQSDPMNGWGGLLLGLKEIQTEEQATDADSRVGITLDAMTQLARYLSGIPGRKNLVWLSGSFPISLYNADLQNPASANRNYNSVVKQTSRLLAESQVAVYPVDVRGLDTGKMSAATNVGIAPGNTGIPAQFGLPTTSSEGATSPYVAFQQDAIQELAQRNAERISINQIAADTGGTAFFSSNAIADAMSIATEQGSNYYALSYSPSNKHYDGRFRKIQVSLTEKGHHLHYRPGYFAADPNSPGREREIAHNIRVVAMQHGSPPSRQIRFSVRVVPAGPRTKVDSAKAGQILLASAKNPTLPSQVEVQHHSIDYAIESSDLRFLALSNGNYRSALTFMVASFDGDGRPLAGVSTVGTSDLQPEIYKEALSGGVRVHQEVDVPVAATSLRVGIQDQLSNYVGTVDLSLPLPAPPDVPRVAKSQLPEVEPD